VAWLTVAALGGCTGLPLGQSEREAADRIAANGGLQPRMEVAGSFSLLSYRRGLESGDGPVHVYLEGDGRPWRGRRPPRNPTPTDPMGLRLAARDPAPSVLWIGRPCMYLDNGPHAQPCDMRWWTSHRYAREVVEALDAIITRAAGGRPVALIGHSGGGALATLLAARREDVSSLLTVAAPLNLAWWVERGRMTPLYGSLDPVDVAHLLADVPQRHLCGEHDNVVPAEVVRSFVRAVPRPNHARIESFPENTHHCCWERDWPQLLTRLLPRAANGNGQRPYGTPRRDRGGPLVQSGNGY